MPRKLTELEVIKEFAVSLLRQNSLEDLLWDIAESIGSLLEFDDCVIYLISNGVLTQRAAFGIKNPNSRTILNRIEIKIGEGIVGSVAASGKSELVVDTSKDHRYISDIFGGKSEVAVPIIAEDQVIGIIDSESSEKHGFTTQDLEIMEALANIASSRIASSMANEERVLAQFKQRKYESQLNNEREWLRTVVNSIQDGIIATDVNDVITVFSATAAQLTGVTSDAAIGQKICSVFKLQSEFEFPGTETEQFGQLIHVSGSSVKVSWKVMPIVFDEIKIGHVIVFRDITREEFLELETERVQRIESLGVLAAGIAHDFNNNLQSLVGCLSTLRFDVSDHLLPILDIADNACDQSTQLSRQLMTFSKGGSPVLEPVDVEVLLKQCIGIAMLGSKSTVSLELEPELPIVLADASQLEQVFSNLLINADQSMANGGTISVSCRRAELEMTDRPAIEISIVDQGVGMTNDELERVFDPYFSTKPTGSGLGLTISFSIVKRHGGEISFASTPGAGTTAKVRLPLTKETLARPVVAEKSESLNPTKKVLVVDDNLLVLDSFSALLMSLGHSVVTAEDEDDAIKQVLKATKEAPIDVAIIDLTIPGKNGGDVIAARLSEIAPEIKLIAVSGYSENAVIQDFRAHGFDSFLKKPFGIEQLAKAIA